MYSFAFLLLSFVTRASSTKCEVPKNIDLVNPCYCDSECDYFDDCCHKYSGRRKYFSCLELSDLHTSLSGTAFVIDKCPQGTDFELKYKCENQSQITYRQRSWDLTIPVKQKGSRRLFKNAYCALCHHSTYSEPRVKLHCLRRIFSGNRRSRLSQAEIKTHILHGKCSLAVTNA